VGFPAAPVRKNRIIWTAVGIYLNVHYNFAQLSRNTDGSSVSTVCFSKSYHELFASTTLFIIILPNHHVIRTTIRIYGLLFKILSRIIRIHNVVHHNFAQPSRYTDGSSVSTACCSKSYHELFVSTAMFIIILPNHHVIRTTVCIYRNVHHHFAQPSRYTDDRPYLHACCSKPPLPSALVPSALTRPLPNIRLPNLNILIPIPRIQPTQKTVNKTWIAFFRTNHIWV
jgi:hypothetical protein